MGVRFPQDFRIDTRGVPMPIWLGARGVAILLGFCLLWALWILEPLQAAADPPVIDGVALAQIEAAMPLPAIQSRPPPETYALPPPPKAMPPASQPMAKVQKTLPPRTEVKLPTIIDRATPQIRQTGPPNASASAPNSSPTVPLNSQTGVSAAPRVAAAPAGQNGPPGTAGVPSTGSAPRLGTGTMAILRARECARLDPKDRPADCPPNEELARILANERGPKYRPENADGFSRNELAWRGIPPPCLDDGENAAIKGTTVCIRFGNVPSRVRSPREICEARGLGGCQDLPSQAAVNSAVEQVRRQETAKTNRP